MYKINKEEFRNHIENSLITSTEEKINIKSIRYDYQFKNPIIDENDKVTLNIDIILNNLICGFSLKDYADYTIDYIKTLNTPSNYIIKVEYHLFYCKDFNMNKAMNDLTHKIKFRYEYEEYGDMYDILNNITNILHYQNKRIEELENKEDLLPEYESFSNILK